MTKFISMFLEKNPNCGLWWNNCILQSIYTTVKSWIISLIFISVIFHTKFIFSDQDTELVLDITDVISKVCSYGVYILRKVITELNGKENVFLLQS